MSACPEFDHLLVLPHLQVQNANATSSPLTHGFPSITALLGMMWALERKTQAAELDLAFKAIGVVCHAHQEQVTEVGFTEVFRLTRNPIDKDGGTAAIVEEGRIHLEVSLILAVRSQRWADHHAIRESDSAAIAHLLASMRIAGGTLLPPPRPGQHRYQPWIVDLTGTAEDRQNAFDKSRMRLLPGFALVSRDDKLETRLEELRTETPGATALDAWLSLSRTNWQYQTIENGKKEWINDRKGKGWIVPIPVGYGALGDIHAPGHVVNSRDVSTPFRFVESLFSVGEWVSPHRLYAPKELLWYADSQPNHGLYRCRNDYKTSHDAFAYDFD